MNSDNSGIVESLNSRDAMYILCLFLAQSDEPRTTHEELGFDVQKSAFKHIAEVFGGNHHTVKLTRDSFDYHTDSSRIGWKEDLRPALKSVWDKYSKLSREELLVLSREILAQSWAKIEPEDTDSINLFDKIERADSKTKTKPAFSGITINFSNTRDNWFAVTIDQLISSLSDVLTNIGSFQTAGNQYHEGRWRSAFDANLTEEVSRALAGTQTLPYFSLLAKIIHYSNRDDAYTDNSIILDKDQIATAVDLLKSISAEDKAGAKSNNRVPDTARLTGGSNTIFYGAPGTGKSYAVDKLAATDPVIRTVFHPDVQNSDFVGSLKPVREDGSITYRFSPGPFSISLVKAMNSPGEKVWLIVEELNRAPAAAVFGDLFLLLDRDKDGAGEYDVDCPSEEFGHWFEEQTGDKSGKIRLPSNLWISATMNSADQGVYPLDTAFRRRWIQNYLPIDYSSGPDGNIDVIQTDGSETGVEWREFIKALNTHLTKELSISEDRLVGVWFVKSAEFAANGMLPGKVLIYLWDDLLRHHGREVVFKETIKSYGDLSQRVTIKGQVFSDGFLALIAASAAPAPENL